MKLTSDQNATVKSYVDSTPALNAMRVAGNYDGVAGALNTLVSPAFIVYKAAVATAEIGLTVNYLAVAAMTTANLDRVQMFYTMNPESFDPNRSDIRTYMADTFSGALGGQGQATRDALEALYRRSATDFERILSSGTGTTVSPATFGKDANNEYIQSPITAQQLVPLWS